MNTPVVTVANIVGTGAKDKLFKGLSQDMVFLRLVHFSRSIRCAGDLFEV